MVLKNNFSEYVCGTRDPPPFMEKSILKFHFDYLNPSLTSIACIVNCLFHLWVISFITYIACLWPGAGVNIATFSLFCWILLIDIREVGNSEVYMHNHSEANPEGQKFGPPTWNLVPEGPKNSGVTIFCWANLSWNWIQTDAQVQKYRSMYPAVVSNKLGPTSPPLPAYFLL